MIGAMKPKRKQHRKPQSNLSAKTPARGSRRKSAQVIKLRIIGGDLGGRTVLYHGADFTRPMKDNIRENLFNIIGPAIRGCRCFDLFAGTGVLALEAVSRGAESAIMVEQNRGAAQWIKKTTVTLGVDDRATVLVGDAFRLSDQLLAPPADDTPWCVLLCPPYALWTESLPALKRIIQLVVDNAPPGSVLAAETERSFDPNQLPAGDWDLREYGGTRLSLIRPAMVCGMNL